MSDNRPTTEQVREAYRQALARFATPIDLTDFDGWLTSVKAEVWDEGAEAVWDRDGFLPYSIRRQNPYRETETT